MTPCEFVSSYRCFGGAYCIRLHGLCTKRNFSETSVTARVTGQENSINTVVIFSNVDAIRVFGSIKNAFSELQAQNVLELEDNFFLYSGSRKSVK